MLLTYVDNSMDHHRLATVLAGFELTTRTTVSGRSSSVCGLVGIASWSPRRIGPAFSAALLDWPSRRPYMDSRLGRALSILCVADEARSLMFATPLQRPSP